MVTKTKKLPPNPLITEILDAVSKARSKAKKIELLKEYDSPAIRAVLIWNYDESVKSMLPDGQVPYNPNEAPKGTDHNQLTSEYKNLYHYVKGGNDPLPSLRRESMFIQLLERLHAEEAE